MKKSQLLCGVIATMSLGVLYGTMNGTIKAAQALDPNTRIIVELDKSVDELTSEEISESQDALLSRIRYSVNPKTEFISSYSVLNNAILINVNDQDVEQIKGLNGVKSITYDKFHEKKSNSVGQTYMIDKSKSGVTPEVDPSENISARTMRKPGFDDGSGNKLLGETAEGEGTLIAVLDNEFYFRGNNDDPEETGDAWNHEVYTPLDSSVKVRMKSTTVKNGLTTKGYSKLHAFDNYKEEHSTATSQGTKIDWAPFKSVPAGTEGSLYFNTKVPFYYDYGGYTNPATDGFIADYDVHSDIDYHGSHVSSIIAGKTSESSPSKFEGIAPNAQIAAMKVFTETPKTQIGEDMGFGAGSGAYDSCILNALEDCIILNVDGINMSLGSDLDDFDADSLTMQTLSKLATTSGIMSSISAGNSGKESYSFAGAYANWTKDMVETGILGSYANSADTTTVASAHPDYIYYETGIRTSDGNIAYDDQIVNNERYPSEYKVEHKMTEIVGGDLSKVVEYVYVPGFGSKDDYSGLDVSNKIAVVNRGSISFEQKFLAAQSKEAAGLFIINNDPTETDFTFRCSFGDTKPDRPVAVVLFKDKPFFEAHRTGTFTFMEKELSKDDAARTISSFSSDGARFDLDLKPDISAPGDIIRGAVPPQKKEDKAETPLNTYQYLSGTSMSAPNYAGAQSLVLSRLSKELIADGELSAADLIKVKAERKLVDMRLMSTANPMYNVDVNPETGTMNYASPRVQGAGMADLYGALNSKIYLEGTKEDAKGNIVGIGKSKIVLRNNEDINKGDLKLSFLAHNEDTVARKFNVKLTVMRPAVAKNNELVSDDYNYVGEVDDFERLPGILYYDGTYEDLVYTTTTGSYKDVYKVTKQLEYYTNEYDYKHKTNPVVIEPGRYYVSSKVYDVSEGAVLEPLPEREYLSNKDVVIDIVQNQQVTIQPGDSTITINPYSLSEEAKDAILSNFQYGTYIEGYVELLAADGFYEDLSMPFLGFYAGGDRVENQTYESSPVVEQFEFEKVYGEAYPSDLVNDAAKTLVGKDNADMGSMWVVGYAKSLSDIPTDKVLSNDLNYKQIPGFRSIGLDPYTGQQYADVNNNLYVGAENASNTMIIQQFVLRSVQDNYFTMTNKATGEVVYKSALEDALFGDTLCKNTLYKSHLEAGYLSAGYCAHRAQAIVPLYNETTHARFPDGEYEFKFNYLLAATDTWVSKSYTIHLDNTPAEVSNIYENNGKVRVEMKDNALSYVQVGYNNLPVEYDEKKGCYFVEMEKTFVEKAIREVGRTSSGQYRLFIGPVDKAYGQGGCIVHFTEAGNYNSYDIVQNRYLTVMNDFVKDKNGEIKYIAIDEYGDESYVELNDFIYTASATAPTKTTDILLAVAIPAGVAVVGLIAGTIAISVGGKKKRKIAKSK